MNGWFAKFRISAALDSGKRLPNRLRERRATQGELRDFDERMTHLNDALKASRPSHDTPPWLHEKIMRSVRQSALHTKQPHWLGRLAWGGTISLAVAVLCMVFFSSHQSATLSQRAGDGAFAPAAGALLLGNEMAHAAPSALVAPLSGEMEHLNNDINKTAEFLMASLP